MESKISARQSGAHFPCVRRIRRRLVCTHVCTRIACTILSVRNTRQKCKNVVTSLEHRNENIVPCLLPYRYHACIVFHGGWWSTHVCTGRTRVLACVSACTKLNPRSFLSCYNCCVFGRCVSSSKFVCEWAWYDWYRIRNESSNSSIILILRETTLVVVIPFLFNEQWYDKGKNGNSTVVPPPLSLSLSFYLFTHAHKILLWLRIRHVYEL